ncbi:MAG: 50S ribosomal protein L32 [Geovibrio sp.]|uniref:50S ribosomal protein L32 n=1 Tax=Geovibrio ferrireducens TaxID=46201 RepID=UPI002246C470|nr:50S ribosomal protein L32 [Geovibrio ferrireducens]MCD8491770.1 50S ribosomal protein L32 [Geovibrio sp.]MCD8568909.1 50S ribosomal protein L32 [Geovibrio sp.]
MGVPKKKTTRRKKGHRRSHHHATAHSFGKCENCGELKLPHRVCPSCGYYKKVQVIKTAEI